MEQSNTGNGDVRPLQIEDAVLSRIVGRALESDTIAGLQWQMLPLVYDRTNPSSLGVYRLSGSASEGRRVRPWSLIIKVLGSPAGVTLPNGVVVPRDLPDDPTLFGYWKREPLTYGAGLLDDLPGGLIAPRCYGVTAHADGSVWLWLDELPHADERCWTVERYRQAARHLGRFNGAYLAGCARPLPQAPWLSRGWLRSWLDLPGQRMIEGIRQAAAWEHPLLRRTFPSAAVGRVLRLWDEREVLLEALERLPHTFCHRDAFRSNLFFVRAGAAGREEQERLGAIDWAFAGAGPLGEEIAPLIAMRPVGSDEGFAPTHLEGPILAGYLHGLGEAGWDGDPRLVRFGFAATAALRYTVLTVAELLRDAHDEARHAAVERRRQQPIERVIADHAALATFLLDRGDAARTLLRSLAAPHPSS